MIKTKLIYIAALIFSAALILMSDKYPFIVLFVLLVSIPPLCVVQLLLTAPFLSIKGSIKDTIIEDKDKNRLVLEIRSFMPVFSGTIYITMTNLLTDETRKEKIGFSALPFIKNKIILKPCPDHCGTVEINVKKLVVRDFASLFKLTKRPKISFRQYILPDFIEPNLSSYLAKTNINLEEDLFSEEKSGDDPSEVFGIREYREGDRLRQIHYKLSAKRDKLISKEYSLPIDKEITLLCAPYFDTLKNANTETFYDKVYSVSKELIKNNIKHTIVFKSFSGSSAFRVEAEADLTDMACVLITQKPAEAPREAVGENTIYIDGRDSYV
ncbi:MAG: DUF58 domain-containing protein [Clostridiales bacterium]|nr:DUF58 domain-containing protein [Clostridiales bacterium]